MSKWTKYGLFATLFLLLAAIPLAKNQPDTGSIEGVIADELGLVPGAAIEAHQPVTGVFMHAESDAAGYYRVDDLRSGHYSLWVQAAGHDSVWIAQVPVERGLMAREDVFLRRTHLVVPTGK